MAGGGNCAGACVGLFALKEPGGLVEAEEHVSVCANSALVLATTLGLNSRLCARVNARGAANFTVLPATSALDF